MTMISIHDPRGLHLTDRHGEYVGDFDELMVTHDPSGIDFEELAKILFPGIPYIITDYDDLPEDFQTYSYAIKDGALVNIGVPDEVKESEEMEWRGAELPLADIEIFKCEDLSRDSTSWREYRIKLRNYPNHPDFPNTSRPVAPTAKE